MLKQIGLFMGVLVFLSINVYSVFAEDFAVPGPTFPVLNISTPEDPGPFYTSSPATLHRHNLYLGGRYIYSAFKTFWGKELSTYFNAPSQLSYYGRSHVNYTQNTLQIVSAYGLTNRLLLGMMFPWKKVSIERTWEGNEVGPGRDPPGKNQGIGDLVVSARYQFFKKLEKNPFFWTMGIDIKLPTGDDSRINMLSRGVGTGKTDYKALMMLSKHFPWGTAYGNLGYNREGRDRLWDTLEYNLALVYPISQNWSLSGEFLGVSYVNWEVESASSSSVNPHHMNTYDAGLGIRFRAKGLAVEFGVTFPLNDDSTRTRWQPTIGINYVF